MEKRGLLIHFEHTHTHIVVTVMGCTYKVNDTEYDFLLFSAILRVKYIVYFWMMSSTRYGVSRGKSIS